MFIKHDFQKIFTGQIQFLQILNYIKKQFLNEL